MALDPIFGTVFFLLSLRTIIYSAIIFYIYINKIYKYINTIYSIQEKKNFKWLHFSTLALFSFLMFCEIFE